MQPPFVLGTTDEYEPGKIIVKMKPEAESGFKAVTGAATFSSRGMSALGFFERAGLVRSVTPIERRSARAEEAGHAPTAFAPGFTLPGRAPRSMSLAIPQPGTFAASTLAAVAAAQPSRRADGFALVELAPETDVRQLQLELAADPSVASVSPVPRRYLVGRAPTRAADAASTPMTPAATPPAASTLWNLKKIGWAEARKLPTFKEATSIKVAVLDTGIDNGHPDLRSGSRYVHQHPLQPSLSSDRDIAGHGTHVAGTIAALINNQIGINGVCDCALHIWKIFADQPVLLRSGFNYYFGVVVDDLMYRQALLDCADEGVDVVNLSIGGPGRPDAQELAAFTDLIDAGTVVVAAMGNEREYGSPISYPAAIPGVIAVGATGINDKVTEFSNRGPHVSLCAPGDGIWSTTPVYPGVSYWDAVPGPSGRYQPGTSHPRDVDYGSWDGTSMASPHVAGAAALLLAAKGKMSPAQVRQALIDSCDKVAAMNGANFDQDYGHGRLNLVELLR